MNSRRLPTDSAMRTHNVAVWVTTTDGCVHTDDTTKLSPISCEFVYTPPKRRDSTVSSRRRRRCVLIIIIRRQFLTRRNTTEVITRARINAEADDLSHIVSTYQLGAVSGEEILGF